MPVDENFNDAAVKKPEPGELANALRRYDIAEVKALIRRGADPNDRDCDGNPAG